MLSRTRILFSLGILSFTSLSANAATPKEHIIVAPQCLLQNQVDYKPLVTADSFVLIKVNDAGIDQLIEAKTHQAKTCGGFIDVSRDFEQFNKKFNQKHMIMPNDLKLFLKHYIYPQPQTSHAIKIESTYNIQHEKEVNQLIKEINPQNMWTNLTSLTKFPNRSARSPEGVQAAHWIADQVKELAKKTNHVDVNVYYVQTGKYKQSSVVAKIGQSNDPGIVIGAHMDTLSSVFENKPGADDDGSGTVTVLEIARILLESGMHFKKPIYLMWYAAEELGLVGSDYVVAEFKKNKTPVDAVLHFDMTGYAYKNDLTMWLMLDNTNDDLTKYLEKLINTYVKQSVKFTRCGYACSDHATWNRNGFKAAMPFEAQMNYDNPYIHTAKDTMDNLNLDHMTDYAKLGVAFAVELAEPISA